MLDKLADRLRGARGVRAPHARPAVRIRRRRARARARSADRGRRRRGAPARHDRRQDHPAGARRAGAVEGPQRPRFAAVDRADAGRRAGGDLRHRRRGRHQCGAVRRGHPRQQAPRHCRPRSRPSASGRPPACSAIPIRARRRAHDRRHRGRRPARPHARFGGLSAGPRFPVPRPGARCARPARSRRCCSGEFTDRRLLAQPGARAARS